MKNEKVNMKTQQMAAAAMRMAAQTINGRNWCQGVFKSADGRQRCAVQHYCLALVRLGVFPTEEDAENEVRGKKWARSLAALNDEHAHTEAHVIRAMLKLAEDPARWCGWPGEPVQATSLDMWALPPVYTGSDGKRYAIPMMLSPSTVIAA